MEMVGRVAVPRLSMDGAVRPPSEAPQATSCTLSSGDSTTALRTEHSMVKLGSSAWVSALDDIQSSFKGGAAQQNFQPSFFMEIVIIAAWHIWKQRKGKNFENCDPSFQSWKRNFKEECKRQAHRFKENECISFTEWIDY
ncbi:hypothetical protein EJB05_25235, partial [Eragrostis curvula]